MLMIELVAKALEVDKPTVAHVYRAMRNAKDIDRIVDRLLAAYRESDLEPIPAKVDKIADFRPAFVNDFIHAGFDKNPYDREFGFVSRALLYSHSVAVRDELAGWDALERVASEDWRSGLHLGFTDCPNGVWAVIRIVLYADYEENNLLHYVPAPLKPSTKQIAEEYTWDRVQELVPMVVRKKGYQPDVVEAMKPGLSSMFRPEIYMMLTEMQHTLDSVGSLPDSIDLYIQDWFGGDFLLGWLVENSRFSSVQLPSKQSLSQSYLLSGVLELPTLEANRVAALSVDDLLRIRESDFFEVFRTDIRDVMMSADVDRLNGDPMLAAFAQQKFSEELSKRRDRLVASVNLTQFGSKLQATTRQGAIAASAAGVAAWFESSDVALGATVAATGGIAAGVPSMVHALARWLITDKESLAAADKLYRVFLSD